MNFETVERCGRIYVVKNGVESTAFVEKRRGSWYLYDSVIAAVVPSEDEAITRIANAMDDWYTVQEAAEVLVELGAFDAPPSTQMMCTWAREGKFPGAVKIQGPGGRGSGGSWRISKAGLVEFAKRRMEQ